MEYFTPVDEVANVLDFDTIVTKFELQLRCYVLFRINIFLKGRYPLTF